MDGLPEQANASTPNDITGSVNKRLTSPPGGVAGGVIGGAAGVLTGDE